MYNKRHHGKFPWIRTSPGREVVMFDKLKIRERIGQAQEWIRHSSWGERWLIALGAGYVTLLVWAIVNGRVGTVLLCTLVAACFIVLMIRMARVSSRRRAAIKLARKHTRWPRLLAQTLRIDEGERVQHEERMHFVYVVHNGRVGVSLLVVALALASMYFSPWFGWAALMAGLVALRFATPRFITWWFTRRCYTNVRVIVVTGVFRKRFGNVILQHIKAIDHETPDVLNGVLDRLGLPLVWDWSFDTLAQEESLRSLPYTIHPSPVQDLLERHAIPLPGPDPESEAPPNPKPYPPPI